MAGGALPNSLTDEWDEWPMVGVRYRKLASGSTAFGCISAPSLQEAMLSWEGDDDASIRSMMSGPEIGFQTDPPSGRSAFSFVVLSKR
ncbi:cobyrinic acid a,c-diamide synthase [Anopheles sinensis]|uniref:Cobyrinic acid a,c-diamide synthase n=1 Tax=Anopheles sinensis TaxID=74873 RepID=A0A084W291_ANOSI|nr:cobyrinic acid a,c-diamide synthase [Anopheles sinensis]